MSFLGLDGCIKRFKLGHREVKIQSASEPMALRRVSLNECQEVTHFDPCSHSPCLNGGSCQNSIGSYYCRCPANYEGPNCESYCKSFLKANRVLSVSKNSFDRSACSDYCIDIRGDVFFHSASLERHS